MKKRKLWGIACALFVAGGIGLIIFGLIAGLAIKYYKTIPEDCNMTDDSTRYGPIKVGTEVILGRHREVNTSDRWVIVMSKWSGESDAQQTYKVSPEFPSDFIDAKIDDGYFIYLIDYAKGKWVVVMNRRDGYSEKSNWIASEEFPENYIDDMWDKDYDITDIEYGNEIWAIVMSDGPDYDSQSYVRKNTFSSTEEFIIQEEKNRSYITDLEYGQGIWVVLTSKGGSIQSQSWTALRNIFPNDFIELRKNESYYIFDVERGAGIWTVLVRRETGHIDQDWFLATEFPNEKIEKYWKSGYYITNVSYGSIGDDNWTYEKNKFVGLTTTVTKLDGVDKQGCPIVRVNIDRENWAWRVRDLTLTSDASGTQDFEPADHEENSGTAFPGQDTSVSLGDGSKIIVLANSIEDPANVRIERNPPKIKSLPSLGKNAIQLSDFYNFEVIGDLIGPVEIKIPYDKNLIPNKPGILTIAYPTSHGWTFTPLTSYNGYVTYQTSNLGDPLIAWHFVDTGRVDLEYEEKDYCEWLIPVKVSPHTGTWNTTFTLHGQVLPNSEFDTDVSNIGLVVKANYWRTPAGGTYYATTDENGDFEIKFTPENDEYFSLTTNNINGFHVLADCDSPKGGFSSTSEGWTTFRIKGNETSSSSSSGLTPTDTGTPPGTLSSPFLYLDKNLFCRTGPGISFPDVTAFNKGQSFSIIGKANNGWYLVAINLSTTSHKSCWIGGGIVSGDLSQVKYYEIQQPSESNGSVPIYDLDSAKVIGYLSCSDVVDRQWWRHPAGWMSSTSLFGSDNALFYPYESQSICGWEDGTPPGHNG